MTFVHCGQTVGWIKMKLRVQVGLGPGHIVLGGYGHSPQFSAHICCGQTAGCIKMLLDMEVDLTQGTLCLMGTKLPPEKGYMHPHQIFGPCLLWRNGWMHEDAAWYGSRPRPRPHYIRRGPSSPRKGHSSPPLFGPCLLWPWSPISATAVLTGLSRT